MPFGKTFLNYLNKADDAAQVQDHNVFCVEWLSYLFRNSPDSQSHDVKNLEFIGYALFARQDIWQDPKCSFIDFNISYFV